MTCDNDDLKEKDLIHSHLRTRVSVVVLFVIFVNECEEITNEYEFTAHLISIEHSRRIGEFSIMTTVLH